MLLIRGMAIDAARAFIRERFGDAGWAQVTGRLPARTVAKIWNGMIFPGGWYEARVLDELIEAVVPLAGEDVARVATALGGRVACGDIDGLLARSVPFDEPGEWLAQAQRVWSEYWSRGELRVIDKQRSAIKLALDNPGIHPLVCSHTIVGWGSAAIRRARREVVSNRHSACVRRGDKRCEYEILWRN